MKKIFFRFIIISIIHYTSGHYVTYIRRKTGSWELHNNLQNKIQKINKIKSVRNINPHLLMYKGLIFIIKNLNNNFLSIKDYINLHFNE